MIKTLKVRVKDKHREQLTSMARSVNYVWNYVNDLSYRHIREKGVFLSEYSFYPYLKGANKELGISAKTFLGIISEYVTRRKQFKKTKLSWRKSFGSQKSLGWIPLHNQSISYKNGQIYHNGTYFSIWDHRGLSKYKFKAGSFNEDSRGRWYFNVAVEVENKPTQGTAAVGIDLGLKDFATCSDGVKIEAKNFYRNAEEQLTKAQRANKKKQVKAINAKIKNRRNDFLHKWSAKLVKENKAIFVGNVNASGLAKTNMAKSVLDAGWTMFRTMLKYKSDYAAVLFDEVNEAFSTQICSSCGAKPDSRPKGIADLGIREWTCTECGTHHDRDVNAAKNILAFGHESLAGGAFQQQAHSVSKPLAK